MTERGFAGLQRGYLRTLSSALAHAPLVALVLAATVALNVALYIVIPKGFFPQQDTGALMGMVQADQSISFQSMQKKLAQLQAIVGRDPDVPTWLASPADARPSAANMFVALKPQTQRAATADDIIARLRRRLARVPGARLYLQAVQDIRIGGRQSNAAYQYTLQADDSATLYEWAPKLTAALMKEPKLTDVNSDQQQHGLEIELDIDRTTAARLNLTPSTIDNTLYDAFASARSAPSTTRSINTMSLWKWRRATGNRRRRCATSMSAPAAPAHPARPPAAFPQAPSAAPRQHPRRPAWRRTRRAMLPAMRWPPAANPAPPAAPRSARPRKPWCRWLPSQHSAGNRHRSASITRARSWRPPSPSTWPPRLARRCRSVHQAGLGGYAPARSIQGHFAGTAATFQASLSNEPMLIAAALAAVYIVLGMLYESTIHPITILSTLPSAGIGAVIASCCPAPNFPSSP